jgi:SSS family solute:Na+ symporter
MNDFSLGPVDYAAFIGYFVLLSAIGYLFGRRERTGAVDYFLAGKTLPWYVVGSSFVASNISSEHFIGMVGAAFLYGICVAMSEWLNVLTFSVLIWLFIPFLLASKVFTTPEFMERRFNATLRQFFAIVTVVTNIVAFLAAVLYGGGVALAHLFGEQIRQTVAPVALWFHGEYLTFEILETWSLWLSIIVLGVVAGSWAIYGGLRSVAWTDFFTVIVMFAGGSLVTILGLYNLAGPDG